IDKLDKDDLNHLTPLFENHDKKNFDDFFLSLGSKRSKELLNLLLKIKTMINNNSFEIEVFLLYLCIENPYLVNLLFFDKDTHICSDEEEHNCFDGPIPTIDQQFEKIKKSLKLFLENDSSKIKY
ncbi:P52 family lipoprotein, partial [Borreliella garinii]